MQSLGGGMKPLGAKKAKRKKFVLPGTKAAEAQAHEERLAAEAAEHARQAAERSQEEEQASLGWGSGVNPLQAGYAERKAVAQDAELAAELAEKEAAQREAAEEAAKEAEAAKAEEAKAAKGGGYVPPSQRTGASGGLSSAAGKGYSGAMNEQLFPDMAIAATQPESKPKPSAAGRGGSSYGATQGLRQLSDLMNATKSGPGAGAAAAAEGGMRPRLKLDRPTAKQAAEAEIPEKDEAEAQAAQAAQDEEARRAAIKAKKQKKKNKKVTVSLVELQAAELARGGRVGGGFGGGERGPDSMDSGRGFRGPDSMDSGRPGFGGGGGAYRAPGGGGGGGADLVLPSAPRERTAEELEMEALGLGGAFRDQARYGERLGGDDGDGFDAEPSRADGDWTKKSGGGDSFGNDRNDGFDDRGPSRADEEDRWSRRGPPQQSGDDPRYADREPMGPPRADMEDRWSKRAPAPEEDRRGGDMEPRGPPRADMEDRWSKRAPAPADERAPGMNERDGGMGDPGRADTEDKWSRKAPPPADERPRDGPPGSRADAAGDRWGRREEPAAETRPGERPRLSLAGRTKPIEAPQEGRADSESKWSRKPAAPAPRGGERSDRPEGRSDAAGDRWQTAGKPAAPAPRGGERSDRPEGRSDAAGDRWGRKPDDRPAAGGRPKLNMERKPDKPRAW